MWLPRHGRAPAGLALAGLIALALAACGPRSGTSDADREEPMEPIESVLERHRDEWMALPGVVGTGIGLCDGTPCIKLFVARPPAELVDRVPRVVGGHPVKLEPTGEFRALDPPNP